MAPPDLQHSNCELIQWSERLARLTRSRRYAAVLALTAIAFLVRLSLTPVMSEDAPYVTVFPAAVVAALLAGRGPGLVSAMVGSLLTEIWIVDPIGFLTPGAIPRFAVIVLSAAFVGHVGSRLRATQVSLRRANEDLRAADRTKSEVLWRLQQLNAELDEGREQARASEAILAHAGEMAHLGAWWIDIADPAAITDPCHPGADRVHWSDEVFRIFGYAPGTVEPTGRLFFDHVPPDDHPRIAEAMRLALTERRRFSCEHRVIRRDGAQRIVLERAEVVPSSDGKAARIVGAVQDISDRKKAEQALRDADQRKTEFLGMLSHELRNPLSPIRSSIYVLERCPPASDQARHARAVIARQSEHLTRLVDDLLDVTRIARGKIEVRRMMIDLRDVVCRTAEDFRGMLDERRIALSMQLCPEGVWVDGDPTRLGQVVGNLLQNAAKFTPPGGRVALVLSHAGELGEIRVRDTGVGIERDLLSRVFEPFMQGERSLARSGGGLGLGLALVKGIAELHGGSVHVESGGRGAGAEFIVRLPLTERPPPPAAAPAGARATARRQRVLVVDDNADAAESLAELVQLFGHAAEVAYDGPSAIEKAHASHPSVVLCDIGLPGLSGYDVARALRAEMGDRVVLFAVTGYAQPEDVKRAAEAGFDGHVPKPPSPDAIERLLASQSR